MENSKKIFMIKACERLAYILMFLPFVWFWITNDFNYLVFNIIFGLAFICSVPVVFFKFTLFVNWWGFSSLRKWIFSSCIGLLAVFASGLSLSLSRKMIHSAMHLDPSFFPSSIVLLTGVFLIPSWLFLTGIILFIFFFIFELYEIFLRCAITIFFLKKNQKDNGVFVFGIICLALSCFGAYAYADERVNNHSQFSYTLLQHVIVFLDYHRMPECENLKNQLGNYLDGNRVSVVTGAFGNINFSTSHCINDDVFLDLKN